MRYIISFALANSLLATPTFAGVPQVVTDIPAVHSMVAAVMGDLGTPVLLLEAGASEHHFQLRPSQARAVMEADLVVWVGPELTPWLSASLANRGAEAARLDLLASPGTEIRHYGDDLALPSSMAFEHHHEGDGHEDHAAEGEGHDHDHEAQDHEGHDHDDHGHSHSGLDPHAWLDPDNGRHWLDLIAVELMLLDPENAATYTQNTEAARRALFDLESDIHLALDPVAARPFVTFHDAYGYFSSQFGLKGAQALSMGDGAAPGAARMAALSQEVQQGEIRCLFPEAQHDPALLAQLAEGTGAKIGGTLDPVGSTLTPGADLYPQLLRDMAQTMAACLKD